MIGHPPALAVTLTLAVIVSAATARGEWVIVQPPFVGQRHCELVYDPSAPISQWQVAWRPPFETMDSCEAMLAEILRRSTAPGRRERLLAHARQHEKEVVATEKKIRREAREHPDEPHYVPPRHRNLATRICDENVDTWKDARCIERLE
jgi:hypothetical protein